MSGATLAPVEHPRDPLLELLVGLREDVAELKAGARHAEGSLAELRQDVRRLDGRIDQVFLVQIATLATALGSLVTALVTALD
jgi:hypothetical protein